MRTPNTIEDEIDAIRLKIYEETKNMTSKEISEYYRKSGETAAKKHGFRRVSGQFLPDTHHSSSSSSE